MNSLKRDFWLQILGGIIRKGLFSIGVLLETHGYINHDQSVGFSSFEVATYLAGLVFLVAPVIWQYAKIRFNIKFITAAYQANSNETPLSVVKNDVITNNNRVSSI